MKPYRLPFSKHPVFDAKEPAVTNTLKAKKLWKNRFDQKHSTPTIYAEGYLIVIQNKVVSTGESRKLEQKFKEPYIISRTLDRDRYIIEDILGMIINGKKFCSIFVSDKIKSWCESAPYIDDQSEDEGELENEEEIEVYFSSGKAERYHETNRNEIEVIR